MWLKMCEYISYFSQKEFLNVINNLISCLYASFSTKKQTKWTIKLLAMKSPQTLSPYYHYHIGESIIHHKIASRGSRHQIKTDKDSYVFAKFSGQSALSCVLDVLKYHSHSKEWTQ